MLINEPYQPFRWEYVKCKECGKIVPEPFLPRNKAFKVSLCLCNECCKKVDVEFKDKSAIQEIIMRYALSLNDTLYEEVKEFLGEKISVVRHYW